MKNLIIIAGLIIIALAIIFSRDRKPEEPPLIVVAEPPPECATPHGAPPEEYAALTDSSNWEPAGGLRNAKAKEIARLQGTTFVALPNVPPPTEDENMDEYLAKFSAEYDAWWAQEQSPERVANRDRIIELSK